MTTYVPMTKSKRDALHLRYDTAEDITLELLLDTDLAPNARSVITEIVALRSDQTKLERNYARVRRFHRGSAALAVEGRRAELPLEMEREDQESAEAEARDEETARQNDLWDAGAKVRHQDELRRMARDDEARTS